MKKFSLISKDLKRKQDLFSKTISINLSRLNFSIVHFLSVLINPTTLHFFNLREKYHEYTDVNKNKIYRIIFSTVDAKSELVYMPVSHLENKNENHGLT